MRVRLLGTGSADGWPNAFCRCASCEAQRAAGVLRAQTSALVDGVLLIDPGPESAAAATRLGESLADVRHVLVTHAHVDHFGPQLLLFRSWVHDATADARPLDVVGPPDVVAEARRWLAPDAPVRFVSVRAGDSVDLDGYRVRVLPAAHHVHADGDAVLHDVTTPDGARLLWACDTGPWPTDWFEPLRAAALDVLLVEETFGDRADLGAGHLDLTTLPPFLDALRDVGAVVETTDVVAVHLSHHNPPEAELERRLAAVGAVAGRDGTTLTVARRSLRGAT